MKIGIIADDLTGANGTGVRFSKQGFTAATIVYTEETPDFQDINAICFDTDSRYRSDDDIVHRITNAMSHFQSWGAEIYCKRIDSTVRGNIGLEIDTMLDKLGNDSVAFLVASFPDTGRISSGGYLLVNNIPVHETDVANDPQRPITESYVPNIIQRQSKHKVVHVSLDKVLSGIDVLKDTFTEQIHEGTRIIVVDAVTDDHIEVIANAMAEIPNIPLVPADPGPLSVAYAKAYFHKRTHKSKIIVTVGSVTSLTGRQLSYLQEKTHSQPVYVDVEKVATLDETWDKEVNRAVAECLERMLDNEVLIITTYKPGTKIIDLEAKAKLHGTTKDVLAKRISDALGKITRLVMEQSDFNIKGCFTSGGDITAALCTNLHAHGIKLEDEVLPLAAYGKIIGGIMPNLNIVTKGGLVGDKRSIFECVRYIKSKRMEVEL